MNVKHAYYFNEKFIQCERVKPSTFGDKGCKYILRGKDKTRHTQLRMGRREKSLGGTWNFDFSSSHSGKATIYFSIKWFVLFIMVMRLTKRKYRHVSGRFGGTTP